MYEIEEITVRVPLFADRPIRAVRAVVDLPVENVLSYNFPKIRGFLIGGMSATFFLVVWYLVTNSPF